MRRALLSVLLVFAALAIQLTMLDRLPLPDGVAPDLVLLVVVALALSGGPMSGMITGFCAGLALDVAPPADHLIGAYALAFCLVGYCCGLVSAELESSVLLPLAASAAGAAVGAALYAGIGVMFGNPGVTGAAVRHVLPLSILYDVLLSPFILYGVALASRLAARLAGAPVSAGDLSGLPLGGQAQAGPGSLSGLVGRTGRTPSIRAAAARSGDGWIGGGGWLAASAELARSRPSSVRVRFGGGRAGSARPRAPAAGGLASGKSAPRVKFGSGRRGDGVVGGGRLNGGMLSGGMFSGLASGLRGGRSSKIFTRRGRVPGAASARFSRRTAWGARTAAGTSGNMPRKGAFNAAASRKTGTAASPRRGTFSAGSAGPERRPTASPVRRVLSSGSPRRGAFSGGSSTKGTFGAGSPRRGSFGGPRRLRSLRRTGAALRSGYPGRRKGVLRIGRPRWRIGRKRNGGYR